MEEEVTTVATNLRSRAGSSQRRVGALLHATLRDQTEKRIERDLIRWIEEVISYLLPRAGLGRRHLINEVAVGNCSAPGIAQW